VHEPQKRAPGLRPQAPITGLARQARPAGVAPRILLLTSILIRAADIVLGKTRRTGRRRSARLRPAAARHTFAAWTGRVQRTLPGQHRVGCLISDEELVPRIVALLADRAELARIQDRAWALGRRDGAIAARLQKAAVGDIVLMHDGARGINRPDELARVLPAFLERIAREKLSAGSLAE
jgi:hypothetical protein